ncbi:MAG: hypothetical protein R3314_04430 [Longimicrobiales bacterium]|nr:hypothetical protein [Longimicrobiales bacterium]
MRRVVLMLLAGAVTGLTACGGGDVTVTAQLEQEMATGETETTAVSSLPVRLIPLDRDAIFDSLEAAFREPEPEIPDSIFDLQNRVIEAQTQWREANARWELLRDSLQAISNRMQGMDQSSGQYFALFQEFNDLEGEVNDLQETADSAFTEFTQLQQRLNTQSREITIARQNWADEAFAAVDSIFDARYEELGREEHWDTTGAQGTAYFPGVPSGEWWVHARYDRQFDELYWNVPIQVNSGEELQVELTEENAEVRQKM